MLDLIFLKILDMSRAACLVIAVILLARLCLKRAPKVISYALWAVVLLRLLCPISIESALSILPEMESLSRDYTLADEPITVIGATDAVVQVMENAVTERQEMASVPIAETSEDGSAQYVQATPSEVILLFAKYVWLAGMVFVLLRATVQTVKLRRRLIGAVTIEKGVCLADHIGSPFVMGLLRPRIYLPSTLSERERAYILLHERHHIRRGDHLTRALAFLALCLHWFNPLVWAAFVLSGRDMEMSCDEAVVRRLGGEIRADYAASLLRLTTGHRTIAPTPLAFGEGDTGGRIRNLSRWKRPILIAVVVAILLCATLAVCLLTDPVTETQDVLAGSVYRLAEPLTDGTYTMVGTDETSAREHDRLMHSLQHILLTADMHLYVQLEDATEYWGPLAPYDLSERMRELIGERVVDTYIARREDQRFLLLAQTQKGETLYAYGWEDVSERDDYHSDDTTLYGLWRLESVFDEEYDKSEFFGYSLFHSIEQPYASLGVFAIAEMPGYAIVGFVGHKTWSHTVEDMGYAVFRAYDGQRGYRLMDWKLYPESVVSGTRIRVADPAVLDEQGRMTDKNTYDIILSASGDLGKIVRYGDDPNEGVVALIEPQPTLKVFSFEHYTEGADVSREITSPFSMTVFAWRDFAKDETVSTVFYDKDGNKMVADMPERVSMSVIEENVRIRTLTLSEYTAQTLLIALENAPLLELTHPVYQDGAVFNSGYMVRVEHVIRDEYVLHDDMVDCFIWEYNGEYFVDGYKAPENGRHIQKLDIITAASLSRMVYPLPEQITVTKYVDEIAVGSVTLTDATQINYWYEEMKAPSVMVALAFAATGFKYDNGYVLRMEYAEEDVARDGTPYLEANVWEFMDSIYYDGYLYPVTDDDYTTWGSDLWFEELGKLFEPAVS